VAATVLLEKRVRSKRTMPAPGNAQPDLMSAGAPTGDSHAGGSSESISKWERPTAADRRSEKIRSWRRRALLKRGARLHMAMSLEAQSSSLAILDEDGIVVCWYASADVHEHAAADVVDRHLSLFYVSEDVARRQPHRDLRAAVIESGISRRAWRRRPDGSAFWSTIAIQPIVLRDGRVQGFSYATSSA
jgi:hypothetical protein